MESGFIILVRFAPGGRAIRLCPKPSIRRASYPCIPAVHEADQSDRKSRSLLRSIPMCSRRL